MRKRRIIRIIYCSTSSKKSDIHLGFKSNTWEDKCDCQFYLAELISPTGLCNSVKVID